MNIKEIKSKTLYKEYALDIPYSEVDILINNKINEILPTVTLPGFRKGKVPVNLVKKKYETNVLSEIIEKLVRDKTRNLLEEKKLKPARQPRIDIKKYEKEKPVEIEVKIDLEPEIKLQNFQNFSLKKYEIDLDKKTLNENYNQFINNKKDEDGQSIEGGGGGDVGNGDQFELRSFPNPDYDLSSTRSDCNGDIDLSFNLWSDNDADYGNTLSTNRFEGSLDMSNSIFDVYNCPEEEVSPVWVDVDEEVDVDFDNGVGDLCSITDDVYVSPDGDDNNIGTSISEAFLTIGRALDMIAPQDDDPVTIFLTEGTFAPSTTGESFPILMISNVNLIGQGEEVTILDAQQTSKVIDMVNCQNNIISLNWR